MKQLVQNLKTLWWLCSPAEWPLFPLRALKLWWRRGVPIAAGPSQTGPVIPPLSKPPASVVLEMASNRETGIEPVDMVYSYVRRGALLRKARGRWLDRRWADQIESPLSAQFREWTLPGERQ